MAEYVTFDPNVETKGAAIMSTIAGLGDEAIPILEGFNLYPIDPENWYSQQTFLNALKQFSDTNYMNEVAIGMKIPDHAAWPPSITTVHDALESINVAYQMNHRGGKIGGYYYTKTGDQSGTMIGENPYPSDFDYGLIYRVVQKFRDPSSRKILVIRDEDQPTRQKGADSCTYHIEW